jgi:hypothetical protein
VAPQSRMTGRSGDGGGKDRTQTSASEDAHDLASATEQRTNEAIDQAKEVCTYGAYGTYRT